MLRGVEDVAQRESHRLVLCNTDEDLEKEAAYIDVAIADRMAGVIIAVASAAESDLEPLVRAGDPDRRRRPPAARRRHRLGPRRQPARGPAGHRPPARPGRDAASPASPARHGQHRARPRLAGYRERSATGASPPTRSSCAEPTSARGRPPCRLLAARRPDPPDAIFVTNNLMTLGALRALRERGPGPRRRDLVGFDDAPWTSLVTPPLSVVAQPTPRSAARPPSSWPGRVRPPRPPPRAHPDPRRPRRARPRLSCPHRTAPLTGALGGSSLEIDFSVEPTTQDELDVLDPAYIDPALDARAATFENPTGARGAGGAAAGGRKGAPSRRLDRGERVVLADVDGPGVVRHVWMTFPPAAPEVMRGLYLEVFYDGAAEPSVVGAVPRPLRPAPRPARRLPLGVHGGQRGPGLQLLPADAVPPAPPGRDRQRVEPEAGPLLPDRLHAGARPGRPSSATSTSSSAARTRRPCAGTS